MLYDNVLDKSLTVKYRLAPSILPNLLIPAILYAPDASHTDKPDDPKVAIERTEVLLALVIPPDEDAIFVSISDFVYTDPVVK